MGSIRISTSLSCGVWREKCGKTFMGKNSLVPRQGFFTVVCNSPAIPTLLQGIHCNSSSAKERRPWGGHCNISCEVVIELTVKHGHQCEIARRALWVSLCASMEGYCPTVYNRKCLWRRSEYLCGACMSHCPTEQVEIGAT